MSIKKWLFSLTLTMYEKNKDLSNTFSHFPFFRSKTKVLHQKSPLVNSIYITFLNHLFIINFASSLGRDNLLYIRIHTCMFMCVYITHPNQMNPMKTM